MLMSLFVCHIKFVKFKMAFYVNFTKTISQITTITERDIEHKNFILDSHLAPEFIKLISKECAFSSKEMKNF